MGNKGTHVFIGDGPDVELQPADDRGLPRRPARPAPAVLRGPGGRLRRRLRPRRTDMRYLCNCADNNYNSLQAKLTKRFTDGYSLLATTRCRACRNHGPDQYFFDRDLEYGSPDFTRTHTSSRWPRPSSCRSDRASASADASKGRDAIVGGWQLNANAHRAERPALQRRATATPARTATPGPTGPNLIGDPRRQRRRLTSTVLQRHADRLAGQRLRPAGRGHLRRHGARTRCIGPGFWNVDASLFKRFRFTERHEPGVARGGPERLQPRQPRQPRRAVGVPGNDNANAGASPAPRPTGRSAEPAVRAEVPVLIA